MNNSADPPLLVELLPNLEYMYVAKEARNLVSKINVHHKLNYVKIETHIN